MGIREKIDDLLNLLGLNDGPSIASLGPVVKSAWEWKEKPPTQDLATANGLGLVLTKSMDLD